MSVLSRLHPRQSLLESLEVGPRHQYFSSTPGCAAQVENDASQKRSCHGTWVVGRERPRAGEVLTLQGATDWAAEHLLPFSQPSTPHCKLEPGRG